MNYQTSMAKFCLFFGRPGVCHIWPCLIQLSGHLIKWWVYLDSVSPEHQSSFWYLSRIIILDLSFQIIVTWTIVLEYTVTCFGLEKSRHWDHLGLHVWTAVTNCPSGFPCQMVKSYSLPSAGVRYECYHHSMVHIRYFLKSSRKFHFRLISWLV